MEVTIVSIVLSLYLTFGLGFLQFSAGLGTSLFLLAVLVTLALSIKSQGKLGRADIVDISLVSFLALSLSLRSNALTNASSALVLMFFVFVLALRRALPDYEVSVDTLLPISFRYVEAFGGHAGAALFSWKDMKLSRTGALSFLMAAPLVFVFNQLFGRINQSYAEFVQVVVSLIFSIDVFKYTAELWVQYALLKALFSTTMKPETLEIGDQTRHRAVTMALIPLCALFFLFSFFQGFAIAQLEIQSEFQSLSLYVQRGFWELVWVGMLGMMLWLVVHLRGEDVTRFLTKKRTISIFSSLCLLVGVFTLHKIGLLQYLFGFKDHRIYATSLTFNLVVALTCTVLISRKLCSFRGFYSLCKTTTLVTTAALALVNVDLVAASINPIRFTLDGVQRKDVSYLIGNSFDGLAAWETLMKETISEGVHVPENYYWGYYLPLCLRSPDTGTERLVIKDRFDALIAKYSVPTSSLLDYAKFNVAEYRAYHWILSHSDLLEKFYEAARRDCTPGEGNYYSSRMSSFSIRGF